MFLGHGQAVKHILSVEPQGVSVQIPLLFSSPSSDLYWPFACSLLTVILQTQTLALFYVECALHSAVFIPGWTLGCRERRRGDFMITKVRCSHLRLVASDQAAWKDGVSGHDLSHQNALRDGIWLKKGEYVTPTTVLLVERLLEGTQRLGKRGGSTRSRPSEGLGWKTESQKDTTRDNYLILLL